MSKENLTGLLSPSIDLNLKIESCKKVWNNETASSAEISGQISTYTPGGSIKNPGDFHSADFELKKEDF